MTTIYFVRHGQASFGAKSYDQLSTQGEQQAIILGDYFSRILKSSPIAISGAMQRHQQTARISLDHCYPEVEISIDAAWNEFNHEQVFALFEPRFKQPDLLREDVAKEANPRAYLAKIFQGAIGRWTSGEFDHEYEESWPVFQQRIRQALEKLCAELEKTSPRYAVVYTSGGVISTLVGILQNLSANKVFELNWAIANSSFTTVRLINGKAQLLSLNEHHFIKSENPELLTWI